MPSCCWTRADLGAQLVAHARVERRERLVEQQHARLDRERAGQRDALLLAAGELVGVVPGVVGEADELEHLLGARRALRRAHLAHPQAELDVAAGVHVGEQAVGLEHHPHVAAVRGHVGDVAAADHHAPAVGAVEAAEQPQRRRLAAARRAEQREQLARGDVEVELVERGERAEAARQPVEVHGDGGHTQPPDPGAAPPRLPRKVIANSSSQVIGSESTDSATAMPAFCWPWLTSSTG